MRLTMDLSLPLDRASVARARHILDTLLSLIDTTDECRAQLALLITEACANAVLHSDRNIPIELAVTIDDRECIVEIGNPDGALDQAELTAGLPSPLSEGGRGLPLIGILADSARFTNPRPGWVVLRIAKRLVSGHEPGTERRSPQPHGCSPPAKP
jgi:anti-sigma regulatory factor (Ser/Thr protein kinase)